MRLADVTPENFYALMRLSVAKGQEDFVAPNDYSLAEAYAVSSQGRFVKCFGLYEGETPVGFAMVGHNAFTNEDCPKSYLDSYYLWRFMIDGRYQAIGYGRKALKLLLDWIRTFPDGVESTCAISYEPENQAAKKLYASFGFVPNGEMDGDEEIAVLKL